MPAAVIGLDVGTSAVRAVELELGDSPQIRRMGQVGLPVGAVVDGEVADVAAVSIALQRLWSEVGFKSKVVRVGMSSARVIVRTIEMPRLSHSEMMSTIQLQLDDYVPLPPDETVFDIRAMDGSDTAGQTQQLVLAATHHDAVQPLVMALVGAHLKVAAVDVIPAALALVLKRPEQDQDDSVDIVLSVGAGTVVVLAAHGGEAVFSRTLTSANGRRTTERIASELAISDGEAELYKRLGSTGDQTSAMVMLATEPSVRELVEEVEASLAFYAEQPSARPVRRLVVTGGGSLLPGLTSSLSERLGLNVVEADPFGSIGVARTGFDPCDLPYLAPYMAAALGVALGATRPKDRRIDLSPVAKRASRSIKPRRLLIGAGAVLLVGAAGVLYVHGSGAIADEQAKLDTANTQLSELRVLIAQRDASGDPSTASGNNGSAVGPGAVAESVAPTDIDWIAVERAVRGETAPLGIVVSSFQGVFEPPVKAAAASPAATTTNDAAAPSEAVAAPVVEAKTVDPKVGTLTLNATAPNLRVVADWLDSIAADKRFASSWASGISVIAQPDGSSSIQFTMEMVLTTENLVDRGLAVEVGA